MRAGNLLSCTPYHIHTLCPRMSRDSGRCAIYFLCVYQLARYIKNVYLLWAVVIKI